MGLGQDGIQNKTVWTIIALIAKLAKNVQHRVSHKKCPPSHFSPQLCLRAEHEFEYICIWKLYYDFILCEYSMDLVQPSQMQERVDDT